MARTKAQAADRPVYLTAATIARLEAGHPVTFQVGTGRGSLGRNPADGRYLWGLTWGPVKPLFFAATNTWSMGTPGATVQGTADSLGDALAAIEAARVQAPR